MTQTQLAQQLNVSTAAVSKWERAICLPEVSKFEDIAKVFHLSLMEVLQCKISCGETISQEDVDNALEASIIIAKYEKEQLKRGFARSLLLIIIGFTFFTFGIWVDRKASPVGIIGRADATTDIFIKTQGPNMLHVALLALGALLVLGGGLAIFRLFRKNERKGNRA